MPLLIIILLSLIILLGNCSKEVEVNYMAVEWKSRPHFKYTNYKKKCVKDIQLLLKIKALKELLLETPSV